jgi:hypothetical protein
MRSSSFDALSQNLKNIDRCSKIFTNLNGILQKLKKSFLKTLKLCMLVVYKSKRELK